jgi:hypothetical protein
MPGNLTVLVMIHSIMGVGLDQDEYLTNWTVYSRLSRDIKQYKALKRCNQTGCVSNRTETNHLTRSHIYKTISMMGLETSITTYDPLLNNQMVR